MDFGTNISELRSIAFPDEGAKASPTTPDAAEAHAGRANLVNSELRSIAFPDEGAKASPTTPDAAEPPAGRANLVNKQAPVLADALPSTLLSMWTRIARANMSVRLYNDLVRVAGQPDAWRGRGTVALRSSSLKNFLDFWSLVRDVATEPEVTLAPDGSLHAEWYKGPRQRLDVRFGEHKVVFGLLTPNSILEGAENQEMVALILKSHKAQPLKWDVR